jgi:hypothetical protein
VAGRCGLKNPLAKILTVSQKLTKKYKNKTHPRPHALKNGDFRGCQKSR